MTYYEHLNNLIRTEVAKPEHAVLFGQNINAASYLSGLTRGMAVKSSGRIMNSTNTENTLVGFGFGLMLSGVSAVFFMKQMDFLLLGIDQLVNTYNIIRSLKRPQGGSFTIVAVVVDSGYEGPQSSLNNFADFCSIARIPGFAITNRADADYLIPKHLVQPGFRILGVSQRLKKEDIMDPGTPLGIAENGAIFHYTEGSDVTLVSFNFSFPQASHLRRTLEEKGIGVAHFNVNSALAIDWVPIQESVSKTKKIVVVDDSKSVHIPADALLAHICAEAQLERKVVIKRALGDNWLCPTSDIFEIDEAAVVRALT